MHYFSTGMVTPYVPSAILSALLMIVGFQVIVFGLLADMVKGQREFLEKVLYRLHAERSERANLRGKRGKRRGSKG